MATVKASEIGIAKLRHAQELKRESWEKVADESYVAKATIYKLLNGDGVTRETVLALTKYLELAWIIHEGMQKEENKKPETY